MGSGSATWTAWPPPGSFPFEAVDPFGYDTLDDTGWTVQSDTIDLATAKVTITVDGASKPVTLRALEPWYGSAYAIAILPDGWRSQVGKTYTVSITGVSSPITYDVKMVGC